MSNDYDFDTVEIETIEHPVSQTLIDAFNRHVWFSQYCLTEIYVLKLPVADQDTCAIAVSGLVGDSWDNACKFLESLIRLVSLSVLRMCRARQ